ncbi:hypothetical protein [Streptomyces sp. NBC_00385]|uniref:hypothetical protein n=1 Tax=Streptomyces sp. NBC_00385 TaxID=2975733 RepID=UPI002DD86101|nr:hypothetical protein [Streptomyces sp. NBC_00385]WRZ03013.1 hypothetical protein OG959_06460 [Streptomyces sp. NBC_00385]
MNLKAFVPGGKLHEIDTFEEEVNSVKIRIVVTGSAKQQLGMPDTVPPYLEGVLGLEEN